MIIMLLDKNCKTAYMMRFSAGWMLYGLRWMSRDARVPVALKCPEWYMVIERLIRKHNLLAVPMNVFKEKKGVVWKGNCT